MKGCMSEVLRSFFSYQVAVGRTMSEYMQVDDMRKSMVTMRSSFPSGASSCHFTSRGFCSPISPRFLPWTPCLVPIRCFRKYSWPLPDAPNRFERQTKRLRGKFCGASGSSHDSLSAPDFRPSATNCGAGLPAFSAIAATFKGLVSSCGAEGSQPMRSARTLKSIRLPPQSPASAVGEMISETFSFS